MGIASRNTIGVLAAAAFAALILALASGAPVAADTYLVIGLAIAVAVWGTLGFLGARRENPGVDLQPFRHSQNTHRLLWIGFTAFSWTVLGLGSWIEARSMPLAILLLLMSLAAPLGMASTTIAEHRFAKRSLDAMEPKLSEAWGDLLEMREEAQDEGDTEALGRIDPMLLEAAHIWNDFYALRAEKLFNSAPTRRERLATS